MNEQPASQIVKRAAELGYDRCGIVPLSRMAGYEEKLEERMTRYPETRHRYEHLRSYSRLREEYPWAQSIIVCSFWYGKYRIPETLRGRIAKYYLTDGRRNPAAPGYQASIAFEAYLREQEFQIAFNRHFGITALRWAAQESGIGIIRKNNFFYTEKGSWQYLEAFLTDQPLQYIHQCGLRPCSDTCNLCMQACPTGSLDRPYSMNRNICISDLTTWSGWDMTQECLQDKCGSWIYGCDACQDACPQNRNSWTDDEEFPGLEELSRHLSPEQIAAADYAFLEHQMQPALWYIPVEKSWKYKINALNAMLNNFQPAYYPVIKKACHDEKEPVRKMAAWVLEKLKEKFSQ